MYLNIAFKLWFKARRSKLFIDVSSIQKDILKVVGKGNKERFIALSESCIKVLNE